MYLAIGVEPTKEIAATSGMVEQRVDGLLVAVHDVEHAVGEPRLRRRARRSRLETLGSRSEGLSTNVLPVAIAIGCIHIGTMIGKLNGVIPAHTPSGCRNECRSTSVETWSENSPLVSSAIPHAYSTTSMPRTTSPLASSKVLPCSAEMIRASSSVCCTTSSRKANITRARRTTETSLHSSNAALAACTAASTSAALPRRT